MSDLAAKLADDLAAKAIRHVQATGDEDLITMIGRALGDSSQTLQEAFITSVRVQRAAIRAEEMIAKRQAEFGANPAPDASEAPNRAPAGGPPSGMAEAAVAPFAAAAATETGGADAGESGDDAPPEGPRPAKRIFSRPLTETRQNDAADGEANDTADSASEEKDTDADRDGGKSSATGGRKKLEPSEVAGPWDLDLPD